LERKLSILRGFIPRHLHGSKKFALKVGVLHPRIPINNRKPLFLISKVRELFFRVFHEAGLRFVFEIRCLRLEGDWLTFYIRPEDGLELPEIMKWMKQTFAQRYNREAGWIGHVWGDRYWSRILKGEPPGEPPEEGTGGRAKASANGDRPPGGKNEAAPGFPPISPRSTAPAPGKAPLSPASSTFPIPSRSARGENPP
jgi:hypothetical protein